MPTKVNLLCEIKETIKYPEALAEWKWPLIVENSDYKGYGRWVQRDGGCQFSCYARSESATIILTIVPERQRESVSQEFLQDFDKFCKAVEKQLGDYVKQWHHVLSMRRAFKLLDDIEVNKKGESESCQ